MAEDRRVEILSRGALAPGQTFEGFYLGESVPVNEKLSDIFAQLRISDKSGRGVPKIVENYGKTAFTFRDNSIVVTIPFIGTKNLTKWSKKWSKLKNAQTIEKILSEIRHNPNVTRSQLSNILGIGESIIYRCVNFLKENNYIVRIGDKVNGYWQMNIDENAQANQADGMDSNNDNNDTQKDTKWGDKWGESKNTKTLEKILYEISRNPNVTKPQLCSILGLGKSTVDRAISLLKTKGIIARVGTNKNGYWKIY